MAPLVSAKSSFQLRQIQATPPVLFSIFAIFTLDLIMISRQMKFADMENSFHPNTTLHSIWVGLTRAECDPTRALCVAWPGSLRCGCMVCTEPHLGREFSFWSWVCFRTRLLPCCGSIDPGRWLAFPRIYKPHTWFLSVEAHAGMEEILMIGSHVHMSYTNSWLGRSLDRALHVKATSDKSLWCDWYFSCFPSFLWGSEGSALRWLLLVTIIFTRDLGRSHLALGTFYETLLTWLKTDGTSGLCQWVISYHIVSSCFFFFFFLLEFLSFIPSWVAYCSEES